MGKTKSETNLNTVRVRVRCNVCGNQRFFVYADGQEIRHCVANKSASCWICDNCLTKRKQTEYYFFVEIL